MQVEDKFIINTQTVQPFTKVQRKFNMKEANSNDNCIGGSCSINQKPKMQMQMPMEMENVKTQQSEQTI